MSIKNISFEFFPPKTDTAKINLAQTAQKLALLKPNFFSVTYGADGSTQQGTLETVLATRDSTDIETTPHLSCIGASKAQLLDIITSYKKHGFKRIIALRGDIPTNVGNQGELSYAVDLVRLIRQHTGNHFHITVAAYPEVHPQAESALKDLLHFKQKVDAGANCAITQFFYNPDAYFNFMDQCIRLNIQIPIIPGIMPILNLQKLQHFANNCGAEIPRWIIKGVEAYQDDLISLKNFSIEVVYKLCDKLLQNDAPGLHFYTLNQADACLQIYEILGLKIPRVKLGTIPI